MNIKPARKSRERILVYGSAGSSKSYSLLTIAAHTTGSQFYVIDNDSAYDRLLEDDAFQGLDAEDGGNVHVMRVRDWQGTMSAVDQVQNKMERDDWLVIDSLTPTWQQVQDYFTSQVFDKGMDEYFLEKRMEKAAEERRARGSGAKVKDSGGSAFEGWKDWPVINGLYAKLHEAILNCPGHLYCTAELDKIGDDDEKGTKATYGPLGWKPKGQKRVPHLFQTVLLLRKQGSDNWKMTTAKDRSRVELNDVDIGGFWKSYLWGVGGWRPKAS